MGTTMNATPDISRFSIYRNPLPVPKRQAESRDLMPLLLRLDELIKFADVTFGQDPPDFVFHHQSGRIGVELTDLNPKVFEEGGHQERAGFKSFEAGVAQTSPAQAEFPWSKVSMRESLEALKAQLEAKRKKAQPWFANFNERWILMHAASGSPFGKILNGKHEITPGMENEVDDELAKMTHAVYSICQEAHPFNHIILFRKSEHYAEMLMFSAGHLNPYKLPVPRGEILSRGAKVSDSFLDWKSTVETVIETKSFSFR
jgi:hypothetical protein